MKTPLDLIIENLYSVFEPYTANPTELRAYSCDCCVNDEEIREITTKPLKELTKDDLGHFSRSAISTFGGISHYKHFLPRILDLMTKSDSSMLGDFTCYEKLNYGEWETWSRAEQKAIEDYFETFWKTVIHNPNASTDQIKEALFILLFYHFNENVFIEWENSKTPVSSLVIVDNILNGWYCGEIKKYEDVLKNWLYSDPVLQKLETSFFTTNNAELANIAKSK